MSLEGDVRKDETAIPLQKTENKIMHPSEYKEVEMILRTIRHIKHQNDPKQRSECKMM